MISGSAYADGNITGTVFNKTTSEPLDFATVVLVKAETGAPLPIGTTNDENPSRLRALSRDMLFARQGKSGSRGGAKARRGGLRGGA